MDNSKINNLCEWHWNLVFPHLEWLCCSASQDANTNFFSDHYLYFSIISGITIHIVILLLCSR